MFFAGSTGVNPNALADECMAAAITATAKQLWYCCGYCNCSDADEGKAVAAMKKRL